MVLIMNVLEKILEEIKKLKQEQNSQNQDYVTGYISALSVTEGIVSKHMSRLSRENNQENTRSPRDNDGWISVEDRVPEESINSVLGWDVYRERCVFVQFLNGRWILGNDIEPALIKAWRPLPEPYRPEKGTEE